MKKILFAAACVLAGVLIVLGFRYASAPKQSSSSVKSSVPAVFSSAASDDAEMASEPSASAGSTAQGLTVRVLLTDEMQDGVQVQTALPEFSGFSGAAELNARITEKASGEISAFRQNAGTSSSAVSLSCTGYFDYSVHGNYLSVWLTGETCSGGAQSSSGLFSLCLDLTTGEFMDSPYFLFRSESAAQALLKKQLVKKIRAQESVCYFSDAEDILAERNGDYPFYLDGDLLVIYFPCGEITPHTAGIPRFEFALKELAADAPLGVPLSGETSRGAVRVNGRDALMNHAAVTDSELGVLLPAEDAAGLLGRNFSQAPDGSCSIDGISVPVVLRNGVPYASLNFFRETLGGFLFYDGTVLRVFR